ncbi:MAG TPA: NUDIX hydrolase [Deltaproteobacteria bacterium]|nr:NUDIX hydrolase [Deltaproteobacteria bacterium]
MNIKPSDAATVILLREAEKNNSRDFEVLMVLRSSKSAFVPGVYVFPGGKVEKEDCLPQIEKYCGKQDLMKAMSALDGEVHSPSAALGVWIAAIRETFEEAGLLLADRNDGSPFALDQKDKQEKFCSYRKKINSGDLSLLNILEKEELILALDRLYYFSRWITPELSPMRYDTRFFVAPAPPNQKALHDGDEVTKHLWITPADALEKYRRGSFNMVAPTVITLEELSRYGTINEVIESTKSKKVEEVLTKLVFVANEVQEHTPDGRIFCN